MSENVSSQAVSSCMFVAEECKECSHPEPVLKERSADEVTARLAQQDKAEQDTLMGEHT